MKAPRFFCDNCGAEVDRDTKKCPQCGRFFASVRCPRCGYTGPEGNFAIGCPACGYSSSSGMERGAYQDKIPDNEKSKNTEA
ncbi:MAG: zinc ribbon domain-containing protein, partial [Treponema sp.]|nr:zinc ribbon domain-containing protein [Treponema sp.]